MQKQKHIKVQIKFDPENPREKSQTQQHCKDECDINKIVARARITGVTVAQNRSGYFADYSNIGDFQQIQNIIASAQEDFLLLPSSLRARFNNSVADLLDFLANPNNTAEAVQLGLMQSPAKPDSATTVANTNASVSGEPEAKQPAN